MQNMKKWMLIPAMAGVVAIGGVALAEDSVSGVSKQTDKMISLQDAKQVAVDKVKGGVVTEIELDKDDGRYHFDVDLKDEEYEYDLEVDAYSGEIIKFEREAKAQSEKIAAPALKVVEPAKDKQAVKSVKKTDSKTMLTKEQVLAIASQHASGVLTDFELDDNVYEIEMEDGDIEYELEIHAYTGAVLSFERDDD